MTETIQQPLLTLEGLFPLSHFVIKLKILFNNNSLIIFLLCQPILFFKFQLEKAIVVFQGFSTDGSRPGNGSWKISSGSWKFFPEIQNTILMVDIL